ncbi:hypothetical protein [Sphaerisporangium sp. TRM90804]|uniref:hypothetical protein n=1 Tax=Sphaerisporangium sp. TRM90804 TaxID=3031113 RepID=UPI00244A8BA7|nr:hypothetical protein [Sphaerisporangium sp. TRM90804]MDH2426526.1 hypothetical protein [Sphaerisporangium sp. TRM90804]
MAVAALLPLTPANAAYGAPIPVSMAVYGGAGGTQLLARVDGTLAFDDANTRYTYSLSLCRVSSFVSPHVKVLVNGVYKDSLYWNGGSSTALCPSFYTATALSAEVENGGTVANVTLTLVGSDFNNNVYRERTRTGTYDNPFN